MDNSIGQQPVEQTTAVPATGGLPIVQLLAVVLVVAIIAIGAYFLLTQGSKQATQKGTVSNPYNTSLGYQGTGYYSIGGQSTYISNQSQLNSALSSSNTTTIQDTASSTSLTLSTVYSTITYNTTSTTTTRTTIPSTSITSTTTIIPAAYTTNEQIRLSFDDPSYKSLSVEVEAVNQTDNSSAGPAYLLNGITTQAWYQVGLSYNWAGPEGFKLLTSQWNNTSDAPKEENQEEISFNGPVKPGDYVELSLDIENNEVMLSGIDLNTGASASVSYNAYGATDFVYLPSSFFWNGIMTEYWHYKPEWPSQKQVTYILVTKPNSYSLSYSLDSRYENGTFVHLSGLGALGTQEIGTYTGDDFITGARNVTETASMIIYPIENTYKYLLFAGNSVKLGNGTFTFTVINTSNGNRKGELYLDSEPYGYWLSNINYSFNNIPFSIGIVFKNQSTYILPYLINETFGTKNSNSYVAFEILSTATGTTETVNLGGNVSLTNNTYLHVYAFLNNEYNTSNNPNIIDSVLFNKDNIDDQSVSLSLGLQKYLIRDFSNNFSNAFLVNVTCVYPPNQAEICAN